MKQLLVGVAVGLQQGANSCQMRKMICELVEKNIESKSAQVDIERLEQLVKDGFGEATRSDYENYP